MIRGLKKRPRSDGLINEKRRMPNSIGRIVYISVLAVFGITVLNFLFGDFVFLRADGLVLRDETDIATTYVARIVEVDAKEGQEVQQGQVLLRLQSTDMLEHLADLSARRARLVADHVDFRVRSETVAGLLPLAQKREDETTRVVHKWDELGKSGFATAPGYDTALTASYNAQQDRIKLATQLKSLESELKTSPESARRFGGRAGQAAGPLCGGHRSRPGERVHRGNRSRHRPCLSGRRPYAFDLFRRILCPGLSASALFIFNCAESKGDRFRRAAFRSWCPYRDPAG